jgi:hypothetical protein
MAGYKRPLSRSELRYIRRKRLSTFLWCAVAVLFVLAGVVGLFYLIYEFNPH